MKGCVGLYPCTQLWLDRVIWVYLKMGVKSRKNQARKVKIGVLEFWSVGVLENWSLEYWLQDRQLSILTLPLIHCSSTPILLLVLGFLHRKPDLIKNRGYLFLNNEMHTPVFGAVRLGFASGNRALLAETDRYQPLSFNAFPD